MNTGARRVSQNRRTQKPQEAVCPKPSSPVCVLIRAGPSEERRAIRAWTHVVIIGLGRSDLETSGSLRIPLPTTRCCPTRTFISSSSDRGKHVPLRRPRATREPHVGRMGDLLRSGCDGGGRRLFSALWERSSPGISRARCASRGVSRGGGVFGVRRGGIDNSAVVMCGNVVTLLERCATVIQTSQTALVQVRGTKVGRLAQLVRAQPSHG